VNDEFISDVGSSQEVSDEEKTIFDIQDEMAKIAAKVQRKEDKYVVQAGRTRTEVFGGEPNEVLHNIKRRCEEEHEENRWEL